MPVILILGLAVVAIVVLTGCGPGPTFVSPAGIPIYAALNNPNYLTHEDAAKLEGHLRSILPDLDKYVDGVDVSVDYRKGLQNCMGVPSSGCYINGSIILYQIGNTIHDSHSKWGNTYEHELTHYYLWKKTGNVDVKHESDVWPMLNNKDR